MHVNACRTRQSTINSRCGGEWWRRGNGRLDFVIRLDVTNASNSNYKLFPKRFFFQHFFIEWKEYLVVIIKWLLITYHLRCSHFEKFIIVGLLPHSRTHAHNIEVDVCECECDAGTMMGNVIVLTAHVILHLCVLHVYSIRAAHAFNFKIFDCKRRNWNGNGTPKIWICTSVQIEVCGSVSVCLVIWTQ